MDDKEKEKFGVIIDKNDQELKINQKLMKVLRSKNINKESKTSEPENSIIF